MYVLFLSFDGDIFLPILSALPIITFEDLKSFISILPILPLLGFFFTGSGSGFVLRVPLFGPASYL